jgi:hypothetical protein
MEKKAKWVWTDVPDKLVFKVIPDIPVPKDPKESLEEKDEMALKELEYVSK